MEQTPFYMTFPMQNLYVMEMEYEKDMERMKELYPKEIGRLQKAVEDRCDELEFEGSRIYDEEPDRRMICEESRKLFELFRQPQQSQNAEAKAQEFSFFQQLEELEGLDWGRRPLPPGPPMPPPRPEREDYLRDLIYILFGNEVYRRRCRNRRCSRWW